MRVTPAPRALLCWLILAVAGMLAPLACCAPSFPPVADELDENFKSLRNHISESLARSRAENYLLFRRNFTFHGMHRQVHTTCES